MSQVKLTLRPPPNVDFVQGYPGIPPGAPDRQQAAVNGALEVRLGPGGVKAKWVRIELRKVETLPGGGPLNTFFDFVGPSPINLWQSGEDFSPLQTQDFPFFIRIPESIPPSLGLEKDAGIKYELIASICTKTKGGFFRRGKQSVTTSIASILIDKHELHSTWPIYQQPDSRQLVQDGVTLTVDRSSTCYGPGDRISVIATVKSDNLRTVILRGFELNLKETIIFRSAAKGKPGVPQVKASLIAEHKVPVNQTLYGGAQQRVDLACVLPAKHTNASVNSARHIDITYILQVRVLLGTGNPINLDLPVIISNWQRMTSMDAINRIGPAPSLSLVPATGPTGAFNYARPSAVPEPFKPITAEPDIRNYNSATNGPTTTSVLGLGADEFGSANSRIPASAGYPSTAGSETATSRTTGYKPMIEPYKPPGTIGSRPKANNGNPAGRMTVTNYDNDIDEATKASLTSAPGSKWLPAEAEKEELYASAKARVERVQGIAGAALQAPAPTPQQLSAADEKQRLWDLARSQVDSTVGRGNVMKPSEAIEVPKPTRFLSAKEEKEQLSRAAQSKAPPPLNASAPVSQTALTTATRSDPVPANTVPALTSSSSYSAGAALYRNAMSNINKGGDANSNHIPSQSSRSGTVLPPSATGRPPYLTAEEEKAALQRRYQEAQAAVNRHQGIEDSAVAGSSSPNPIAYDSLYPQQQPPQQEHNSRQANIRTSGFTVTNPSPPAFSVGGSSSAISEKERLRQKYAQQDAAASSTSYSASSHYNHQPPPANHSQPPSSATYTVSPSMSPSYAAPLATTEVAQPVNALTEKEILRRKYAALDAAATTGSQVVPGYNQSSTYPSAPPILRQDSAMSPPPPISAAPPRGLTAAEEKALMKAKYEAEEAQSSSARNMPNSRNGNPPSDYNQRHDDAPSGPPPDYP